MLMLNDTRVQIEFPKICIQTNLSCFSQTNTFVFFPSRIKVPLYMRVLNVISTLQLFVKVLRLGRIGILKLCRWCQALNVLETVYVSK